jgi:hypothetical protein
MTRLALPPPKRATVLLNVRHAPMMAATFLMAGSLHLRQCSRFLYCFRLGVKTDDARWLYTPILTVDANFRLKCKDKKVKNDPALGDGWAYWVPEGDYQEYITAYGHQKEVGHHDRMCDWGFINDAVAKPL